MFLTNPPLNIFSPTKYTCSPRCVLGSETTLTSQSSPTSITRQIEASCISNVILRAQLKQAEDRLVHTASVIKQHEMTIIEKTETHFRNLEELRSSQAIFEQMQNASQQQRTMQAEQFMQELQALNISLADERLRLQDALAENVELKLTSTKTADTVAEFQVI